ncbi:MULTISPECIES: hypothetical protein [unclassified Burkholderia]|uniref:hypothetical protein n=1 Tax=unclassified Burkholderia TaxID=2613784 RepID=UPI000B7A047E|nr:MULTISPECIES: hypothetical protein [unclassified Burkholderia]NIE57896.1 hypothetical protein [Burkholderia sp. Ap-955]NIF09200.1 hypothetical protein [Burkholderia sp. Ax-1735]NIG06035.1 hypothetical protein [Burkholderia sp. Tr-849]OXI81517.1 hypothetical protein CFB50_24355 [Burkholderia sp. AU33423]
MTPIPAARCAVFALTTLTFGGCYYTSPYGYAPYYAPAPATLTQREIPVTPAAPGTTAPGSAAAAVAPPVVDPAPVYVAPAYPPPYPYPYPYYAPAYYPGWYGWGAPAISVGFWGGWGGGWRGRGGYGHRPWGGGHWGGGWGGHRH